MWSTLGNHPLIKQFVRFGAVGVIGFIIDAGLLYLLVRSGVNAYVGRAISFPAAVSATWYLNRAWTFRVHDRTPGQYARYVAVQLAGACANYAVYAVYLSATARSAEAAIVALAAGSVAGLIINFTGTRALVFAAAPRWRIY
jgi:putative flippase GtrA